MVNIIVGGQYGSEGKGKVSAVLASKCERPHFVRCGGPNSGHTVTKDGKLISLRQLSASTNVKGSMFYVSAGCVIDEDRFIMEADLLGIPQDKLIVDPMAILTDERDKQNELNLVTNIGSTGSGNGAAFVRRIQRLHDNKFVSDSPRISSRVTIAKVSPILNRIVDNDDGTGDEQIFIEGTQGFGLSVLHGMHYPFTTSRETSAAGFLSEVGLSPRLVTNIIVVFRTFPIRVGGPSGPFKDEITWEEVAKLGKWPEVKPEYTTVTNRLRRVARWDMDAVKLACQYNRPTALGIMGIDRYDYQDSHCPDYESLTDRSKDFIKSVEDATGVKVLFIGTGPLTEDVIAL